MYGCYTSADLCAVRISVLNEDGSPIFSNVDGSAYDLSPISLQINPTSSTGDTFEQRNGCGDICFTRTNPDSNTGADLVLQLCEIDYEFIALALGTSIIVDGSAENIGVAYGTSTGAPVEFHAWAKTYADSSAVASPRTYVHHVFPNVTWTVGSQTLQQNARIVTLNGTATTSSTIGDGGFGDIPETIQPGIAYYWAEFVADDIPVATEAPYNANGLACGYVDTPADDS